MIFLFAFIFLSLIKADSATRGSISENYQARELMPFKPSKPVVSSLPRVSVEELEEAKNQRFKLRRSPFILTGAMEDWPLMSKWSNLDYLTSIFPEEVCDFYPYNMLKQGQSPYLIRFKQGVKEVLHPPGQFRDGHRFPYSCDDIGGCRYLHLQLTPDSWSHLESIGDIPVKRHPHTKGDNWWMRRCLSDPAVREEYHIKTHWKIILIGTRGSGMFNHSDSLQTSSWHGHVVGRKWWYICSPEGTRPQQCFESVLHPGEILYYGKGWFHETRNLDSPGMTITGTIVNAGNHEMIAERLFSECAYGAMHFDFSAALCDSLDLCYNVWHTQYGTSSSRLPWRDAASRETISKKEAMRPHENNYDGRNYIAENQ